jgi:hypothetical protein
MYFVTIDDKVTGDSADEFLSERYSMEGMLWVGLFSR